MNVKSPVYCRLAINLGVAIVIAGSVGISSKLVYGASDAATNTTTTYSSSSSGTALNTTSVISKPNHGKCSGITIPKSFSHLIPPANQQADYTYIQSDSLKSEVSKLYTFQGDVQLYNNDLAVSSNYLIYKESVNTLEANGEVNLKTNNALFNSSRLFYQLDKESGQLDDVDFLFPENHVRGKAQRLNILSKDVTELSKSTYTTCDEERPAWQLHAQRIVLDTAENVGTANNVWIDFMRVPIFYLPYISFPLSGRKTGFLIPTFGLSSSLGTELSVPYYLNLAPDRDATLTVENFTKRGQRLLGEFRFLNKEDAGQLNVEYLQDDKVTNEDRDYLALTHNSQLSPRLSTNLLYRRVSDKDYFEDFGNQLSVTNIVHLESRAEVFYRATNWSLQGRVIEFQTLDDNIVNSARPYKKRPEFTFTAAAPAEIFNLLPEIRADYVQFDGKDRVSGGRLDIQPSVSMPYEVAAGFIIPKFSVRYTQYSLNNQLAAADDSPSRTLPVFSLDSGLFFEREVSFGENAFIQTLEPRLFYLNVPLEDQSNLIVDDNGVSRVFDTSLANQSFSQLFTENRFTGADRVADANQLSVAVTSRVLREQTGIEIMSASIGRTLYFQDREVTLPGAATETTNTSDYFAEFRAKPHNFLNINSKVQWDNEQGNLRNGSFQLQYNNSQGWLLNFGYLNDRDNSGKTVKQESDISVLWPISHNWRFIGRRNYNHFENRSEEKLAGLEYDDCCWAFRVVSRRYLSDDLLSSNRSILFQFELKGLTSIGRDVKSLLQNSQSGISGY